MPSGNNWEVINDTFIAKRAADFKLHIGDYFVVNDLLYTMCFCKFIAASDNRCKNTYLYCDPVTHKIGFMQDDLDTIFSTDNVGRKNKPYYVEEHDLD
jgi:spore coat protein CotH